MNKVILMGNLGADPELKVTPQGTNVANVNLATNKRWNDRQTSEKKEKTEWHRLVAFESKADLLAKYFTKGSKLLVEGELQTRTWEAQDGQKRYMTEVLVRDIHFVGEQAAGAQRGFEEDAAGPPAQSSQSGGGSVDPLDDGLPFSH